MDTAAAGTLIDGDFIGTGASSFVNPSQVAICDASRVVSSKAGTMRNSLIGAPTSMTIQSVFVGGTASPSSSITAGSFVPDPVPTSPTIRIRDDLAGTFSRSKTPSSPSRGS